MDVRNRLRPKFFKDFTRSKLVQSSPINLFRFWDKTKQAFRVSSSRIPWGVNWQWSRQVVSSLISESDWTKKLPKRKKGQWSRQTDLRIYQKVNKLEKTKVVQEQKDLSPATAPKMLSAKMHTSSRNLLKAVSLTGKWGEVWPWGQAMSQVLSPVS